MATDRYIDLLKQGFMRSAFSASVKKRAAKAPPPIVACDACRNWHRKGKHTAPIERRKANAAKSKAERA